MDVHFSFAVHLNRWRFLFAFFFLGRAIHSPEPFYCVQRSAHGEVPGDRRVPAKRGHEPSNAGHLPKAEDGSAARSTMRRVGGMFINNLP